MLKYDGGSKEGQRSCNLTSWYWEYSLFRSLSLEDSLIIKIA